MSEVVSTATESLAAEESQPAFEEAAPPPSVEASNWTCPTCGEQSPATFELCWNCANNDAASDNDEVASEKRSAEPENIQPNVAAPSRCLACGSQRIIPEVQVVDRGQGSTIQLAVDGNRHALVFKNRIWATCEAIVCGDCGHVQFWTRKYQDLYQHYLDSQTDE